MELTMSAQDDASPWDLPPKPSSPTQSMSTSPHLHGRGYFSELGVVRRKPCESIFYIVCLLCHLHLCLYLYLCLLYLPPSTTSYLPTSSLSTTLEVLQLTIPSTPRRTPNPIQVMLRQDLSQAKHLPPQQSNLTAHQPLIRLPDDPNPAHLPTHPHRLHTVLQPVRATISHLGARLGQRIRLPRLRHPDHGRRVRALQAQRRRRRRETRAE
jgi:hypothetical protein